MRFNIFKLKILVYFLIFCVCLVLMYRLTYLFININILLIFSILFVLFGYYLFLFGGIVERKIDFIFFLFLFIFIICYIFIILSKTTCIIEISNILVVNKKWSKIELEQFLYKQCIQHGL